MSDEIRDCRDCFNCHTGTVKLISWIPVLQARPAYCVVCDDCGINGPTCSSEDDAIAAWNEIVDAVSKYRATKPEVD